MLAASASRAGLAQAWRLTEELVRLFQADAIGLLRLVLATMEHASKVPSDAETRPLGGS